MPTIFNDLPPVCPIHLCECRRIAAETTETDRGFIEYPPDWMCPNCDAEDAQRFFNQEAPPDFASCVVEIAPPFYIVAA